MTEVSISNRAEQVRRTRRHERGAAVQAGMKLSVDETKLDRKNYVYRFVNDTPGRIQAMTVGGEWDVVEDAAKALKSDSTSEGTGVSVVAGTAPGGAPMRTVLLRKPKWIHEEDRKTKMADLDRTMSAIKHGKPETAAPEITGNTGYVPGGAIEIR